MSAVPGVSSQFLNIFIDKDTGNIVFTKTEWKLFEVEIHRQIDSGVKYIDFDKALDFVINSSKNFRDFLDEEMKDPDFKREWDALEDEFNLIREDFDSDDDFSAQSQFTEEYNLKHG